MKGQNKKNSFAIQYEDFQQNEYLQYQTGQNDGYSYGQEQNCKDKRIFNMKKIQKMGIQKTNKHYFNSKKTKIEKERIERHDQKHKSKLKSSVIIVLLCSILCLSLFMFKIVLEIKQQHYILQLADKQINYYNNNQQSIQIHQTQRKLQIQQIAPLPQNYQQFAQGHAFEKNLPVSIDISKISDKKGMIPNLIKDKILDVEDITPFQDQIQGSIKKSDTKMNSLESWNLILLQKRQATPKVSLTSQIQSQSPYSSNPDLTQNQFQQSCQLFIRKNLQEYGDLYMFKKSNNQMIQKAKNEAFNYNTETLISKQQYIEAIDLLYLTHRIDKNLHIIFNQNPCDNTDQKRQRAFKAVNERYIRWNEKYEINKYHSKQLKFCIVVNSYNNGRNGLIYRNIDSILQQNYTNYHVVYHDDASTDSTGQKVKDYLLKNEVPEDKFKVEINPLKVGMMANIYKAMMTGCNEGEIAVMLDGDDSLIGIEVLSLLNAVYQKQKLGLVWANFVWVWNNEKVNMGFSRGYSKRQFENGVRYTKPFVSSHLKSFYVDLFRKIKISDLQQNNGQFYGGASDNAMMFPMTEMASSRIKYLPEILYEYRYDTGQVGNIVNADAQRNAIAKIQASPRYDSLFDFSFIDRAIQNAMQLNEQF